MPSTIDKTETETSWLRRCSWIVLGLGLAGSAMVWQRTATQEAAQADEVFERQTADATARLGQQLERYTGLIQGFRAMFMVSEDIDRATFHRHFTSLNVAQDYPALMALQFHQRVMDADKAAFEASVRADRSLSPRGYPDYKIHPPGSRPEYVAVNFNEPMEGNEAAMGLDGLAEPARRESMELARDTTLSRFSGPLDLFQVTAGDRTGFVVRVPVYRPQADLSTVTSRRQAYLGQLNAVFRASDLMRGALNPDTWTTLNWQVVDEGRIGVPSSGPGQVLFDSSRLNPRHFKPAAEPSPDDQRVNTLNAGGRDWHLRFTRPAVNHHLQPFPLALLVGGLLASVGLWWALRSAAMRHHQAAEMALELSHKARDSEHRLRSVLNNTVDGIVTIAPSGMVLSVNEAMCAIFGYAPTEMVHRHVGRLLPGAAADGSTARPAPPIGEFFEVQAIGMDGMGRRTKGQRASGELFPLDLAVSTMELDGQPQYIAILRDLSEQQQAEMAYLEAQRQLNEVDEMRRVIVHNAPYAIFVISRQGIIQAVNPAGETLLGYRPQDLVGRSSAQRFFDPDQVAERAHMLALRLNQPLEQLDVLMHLAKESPGLPTEWTMVRADGRSLVAEVSVTELSNEVGDMTGYLVMAQDVTTRREAENQLQHMAMHDALTALPNRNMLQEQLKASVVAAEHQGHLLALMFIDLDRFKKINDTLGHHIGDSVLIEVARRLRTAMRTSDIVARLGGDEFVILLPQIAEVADGERVAQKVIDLFSEPLRVGPHELRVTPSVGLVLYPGHGQDAATLMRHADLAMYQAKSNGRNRIQVYSDKMESPTADTLVLENDLYKAMERDELRLHYQPQFDCATGQITGAEALLRWEHKGKLVPPIDFIPLAEESGLIIAMGEWVLREACARAQEWRVKTKWPLRIAVNLSAIQLDHPGLADTVARALKDTGLPPTALELEITESVVVRESLRAADILTQLRAVGVSIAIDDFGVGYSSFAYLRELPVDRFKLDRSFLASVPQSTGDARLAAALIAMAHRLEVGIVAEGVETAEQKDFLRDHGCDEAQGYHLGRPMKGEAFEALLVEHSRLNAPAVLTRLRADQPA